MGRGRIQSFKQQFSLHERCQESQAIIANYPDRVPVVVERYSKTDLPEMEKRNDSMCLWVFCVQCIRRTKYNRKQTDWLKLNSFLDELFRTRFTVSVYWCLVQERRLVYSSFIFLVPRDMSVGQFIYILSGRLHLSPGKALFVFVKDTLPQTSSFVESVYDSYKDDDGFLYMCYSSEKTFGCVLNPV